MKIKQPVTPLKETIYTENWLKEQDGEPAIHRRARNIRDYIKKLGGVRTVVDIGCGAGITVDTLRRAGYQAYGMDSQDLNINYCIKTHKRGLFIRTGTNDIPSDNKYDAVVATHVLEHWDSPDKFIKQVKQITSPGGYIIISVPNLLAYDEKSWWRRNVATTIYSPDHIWAFTPSDLRLLFKENCIEIMHVFTDTRTEVIITGYLRTVYHWFKHSPLTLDNPDIYKPLCSTRTMKIMDKLIHWVSKLIAPVIVEPHGERGVELTIIGRVP